MDINAEGNPLTIENHQQIHRLKTGALITTALVAGAIIGDASELQMSKIIAFGDALGLAFQIIDDVLDVTAGKAKRGASTS
jgi:geranylgeranyl diphosphate synthase type II